MAFAFLSSKDLSFCSCFVPLNGLNHDTSPSSLFGLQEYLSLLWVPGWSYLPILGPSISPFLIGNDLLLERSILIPAEHSSMPRDHVFVLSYKNPHLAVVSTIDAFDDCLGVVMRQSGVLTTTGPVFGTPTLATGSPRLSLG